MSSKKPATLGSFCVRKVDQSDVDFIVARDAVGAALRMALTWETPTVEVKKLFRGDWTTISVGSLFPGLFTNTKLHDGPKSVSTVDTIA